MIPSTGLEAQQKNWLARNPRAKGAAIAGAAFGFFLLFVAFTLFCIFGLLRNSDPVRLALTKARSNPAVAELIGQPIHEGWFVNGKMNVTGDSGRARLVIPIDGPHGKGTIHLVADKSAGTWRFSELQVEPENGTAPIDLLETSEPPIAQ